MFPRFLPPCCREGVVLALIGLIPFCIHMTGRFSDYLRLEAHGVGPSTGILRSTCSLISAVCLLWMTRASFLVIAKQVIARGCFVKRLHVNPTCFALVFSA